MVVVLAVACGDDEGDGDDGGGATAGTGGGGGSGGMTQMRQPCSVSGDCATDAICGPSDAAIATCVGGFCETTCDAGGYVACNECPNGPSDCSYEIDMCPPPDTPLPTRGCLDSKCYEYCGLPAGPACAGAEDCPQIRCPGVDADLGGCVGGQCQTVAERCCTP